MDKEYTNLPSSISDFDEVSHDSSCSSDSVIEFYGMSISKKRDYNEDAFFLSSESRAFGVFDGVGSTLHAGRASHVAAEAASGYLDHVPHRLSEDLGKRAIEAALLTAHFAIVGQSTNDSCGETTGVAAKFFVDNTGSKYLAVAHAGDSRAYRLGAGYLDQMTYDHGYKPSDLADDQLFLMQQILGNVISLDDLSERMLEMYKKRNIVTSTLGSRDHGPVITANTYTVADGQKWLLTSDGVHDNLTTEEMENILLRDSNQLLGVHSLVRASYQRSLDHDSVRAKRDDITAVIARVK